MFQNEDISNYWIDLLSNLLVKDDYFSTGFVYWICKESKLVKIYKLKDFKVNHNSYNFTIQRIFFFLVTKFSLEKDKSVENYFVALELLKNCLFITQKLKSNKTNEIPNDFVSMFSSTDPGCIWQCLQRKTL